MTKESLRIKPSVFLAALLLMITGLLTIALPADADHFEISATVGEPVQYGYSVSNGGSEDVPASFTIEYPASFTGAGGEITQGTGTCTTVGNTVTCEFVTPPGQTYGSVTFAIPTEAGLFTAPYTYVLISPRGTDTIRGHVTFRVLPAQEPAPQPEPQPVAQPEPQPVAPTGSQNATVRITGDGNDVSVDQSLEQNAFSPTVSTECQQQASGMQQCPGGVGFGDGNSAAQQVQ